MPAPGHVTVPAPSSGSPITQTVFTNLAVAVIDALSTPFDTDVAFTTGAVLLSAIHTGRPTYSSAHDTVDTARQPNSGLSTGTGGVKRRPPRFRAAVAPAAGSGGGSGGGGGADDVAVPVQVSCGPLNRQPLGCGAGPDGLGIGCAGAVGGSGAGAPVGSGAGAGAGAGPAPGVDGGSVTVIVQVGTPVGQMTSAGSRRGAAIVCDDEVGLPDMAAAALAAAEGMITAVSNAAVRRRACITRACPPPWSSPSLATPRRTAAARCS